jgi:hypothetical protein
VSGRWRSDEEREADEREADEMKIDEDFQNWGSIRFGSGKTKKRPN